MKHWLLLFVTALSTLRVCSQSGHKVQMKGRVYDNEHREYLSGASIACLYAKDSSRAALAFTDKDGLFYLDSVAEGRYYIYVTFLGYQPLLHPVDARTKGALVDLGNINMHRTGVTLGQIDIVETRSPVKMSKDTIEFNAAYFKTRENSVLEELFRKIPGLQVDKDGNITINGQPVKTILVNGRPFFADNPKLAVKNLQADLVDKIQLIDRKVKERDPTAFSDGRTEKAINITIKKNRLDQLTGQLTAGYGTDDRFATKASVSRFDEHQQLAFFGGGDNTNGYQEGGAGIAPGVSRIWNSNFNYTADISEKMIINSSYSMENNRRTDQRNSFQQYFLQDSSYFYRQRSLQQDNNTRHSINTRLNYKIDSLSTLIVSNWLNFATADALLDNEHASHGNQSQLLDSGSVNNHNRNKVYSIVSSISFERKFLKAGRALNIMLDYGIGNSLGKMFNLSATSYLQSDGKRITDTLNQYSELTSRSHRLQFMVTYTEPLFKDHFLNISYGLTHSNDPSDKSTYDYNKANDRYDQLNDSLSSYFGSKTINHLGVISLRAQKPKYDYEFSLLTMFTSLNTTDIGLKENTKFENINFLPRAFLNYAFTNSRRLRISYIANPQLPNPEQLRPVPDNSNPLFIKRGNPDLKPGSSHQFDLSYNSFNTSMRTFSIGMSGGFVLNQIVNSTWLDSLNRQISQPINMSGAYTVRLNIGNTFHSKKNKTLINTNTNIGLSRDVNYVNGIKGNNQNFSIAQSVGYIYSYKELFDFNTSGNISYNRAQYSGQLAAPTNYFNYGFSFDGNINLPAGFMIGTNLSYSLMTGRGEGYNTDFLLWNASLSKVLFPDKQGLIKLQGFDLLNRNVSISRNIGPNYIEDVQTNVLQRFVLLSFTYFIKERKK